MPTLTIEDAMANCGGVVRFRRAWAKGRYGKQGWREPAEWRAVTHKRNKEGTWRYEDPTTNVLSEAVFPSREACLAAVRVIYGT